MRRPLKNSYWVLPGNLLAGEYPYGDSPAKARARLRRLLAAGVNTFIDLTLPGELPEYQSLLPSEVKYLRYPIQDAAVPDDAQQMHTIQAHLQAALAAGRRVYVHCRAGVGRTGTVIGCYLAEQGLDGAAALQQLNRLWKQSGRALTWPEVPQTHEQAQFIRSWAEDHKNAAKTVALSALRVLRGRFLGGLMGLAIGDALGAATQFRRPGSFAPIGDLIGGGPFDLARGEWSDDTAMALCLAESLLDSPGFQPDDQLQRYSRWQQEGYLSASGQCLGITAATARALAGGRSEATPMRAVGPGASSAEAAPLARVAPVVMYYFAEPPQAIALAEAAARVCDAAPVVLDACRLLAAMMHAALRGEPLARVLQPSPRLFSTRPLAGPVAALLTCDPLLAPGPHAEPALTVLASARWALASGVGFRGGALLAANLGGDADVIGAVYGQLAGALYGQGAIPPGWLAALAGRALLEGMADRLLTAALVGLSETAP